MENNQRNPTWGERLDNFIGFFSPAAALARKAARFRLRLSQEYDAAAPWRNSANWIPADGRAEEINRRSRPFLRNKARYLERNSEIVNSVLNAYLRNVVGKGFNLQVKTDDAEWNSLLEAAWREWCKPGNCDVTGQYSLTEILSMIVRRKLVDGGILLVKIYDKNAKIPFQVQLREVDDIDAFGQLKSPQGNLIVDGVEVNQHGKHLSYYLKQYDWQTLLQIESERISADRVYYLFEKIRPSQVREITRFARTIDKINDLDEFFQAVIFAQKITAAIAIFITSDDYSSSGVIGRSGSVAGSGSGKGNDVGTRIDPGSIKKLNPGEKVESLVPSGQTSELNNFNLSMMRQISSGQGLSYEQVTRDVSQVNYSSARQNLVEDWKVFSAEQQFLIEYFLDDVFEQVIKSAILKGFIPAEKLPRDFWKNPEVYLKHQFVGQSMPWIDPYKEALANQILLASYQMTLHEYCAKTGRDYEEVIEQILKENEALGNLQLGQKGDNAANGSAKGNKNSNNSTAASNSATKSNNS